MNTSQLENPIWNSLRTDHARIAEGDDCARRYPHEIGPLAGIADQSDASYNSLRTLAGDHSIALFSLDPINPRGSWTTIRTGRVIQMVRTVTASTTDPVPTPDHKPVTMPPDTSTTTTTTTTTTSPTAPAPTAPTTTPSSFVGTVAASTNPVPTPDHKPVIMPPDTSTTNPLPPAPSTTTTTTAPSPTAPSSFTGGSTSSHRHGHSPALDLAPGCTFRRLTSADAPAMVALAELTEPGPFRLRTIELGNFYGIFDGDRLVSMAGKRMHFPGFIEVSGVCTHPDYRGRGYAGALIRIIIDEIEATGRTPFLHAWEGNPAQYLYESLGFSLTRTFNLSALAAA
ncbi:GNAT family N-acetyltransferase [Occallatibacter riparius]|uniref:GNAT family N-acetyltransferase n=1 Tax=Occallatibacter riparius TaxID=1002689 RepID=A0A9J7BKW2_9BACT|nr:GNAT family N-acetyltransferase [Occallatibacter riparius]UWZ83516.1 GNAT family N-acetyltransferase [Occallatibacter riparius]